MTLLLILVLLVVLFGGGYYGHRQWGPRGGLGIVGLVLLIALVLWLLGAIPGLGQDATPPLEPTPEVHVITPAEIGSEAAAVLVKLPTGEPAVAVELPANAHAEDAKAIGEQSADDLKAVASGEVTIEQATRDPTKSADPGAGMLFPYLMTVAAAVSRWALGVAVRRSPTLPNSAIGLISNGIIAAVVVAGFFLLHSSFPDAPQTLVTWCWAAGLGSMIGSMAQSGTDWRNAPLIPPAAPPESPRP